MMTVHEVSRLTGVSVRALHHYDAIGLLRATDTTPAGYRLYDGAALERLQQILLFRELEFSLKEIGEILDSPGFDRDKALEQQIRLLELRRDRLSGLIFYAREIREKGVSDMKFEAFGTDKIDEYAAQARAAWGETDAWREYERKTAGDPENAGRRIAEGMTEIFRAFGRIRNGAPDSAEAAALVGRLQAFITENCYTCTDEILLSLGHTYADCEAFSGNIDRVGGDGTAAFAAKAIEAAVGKDGM